MTEQLPTVGGSAGAWGTDLNDYLQVGHSTVGRHDKTEMLADMEWSPAAYIGGESVTFPNGLIFKHGIVAASANPVTITFDVAFPTKVISHNAISAEVSQQDQQTRGIATISTYKIYNAVYANIANYSWQVWGY